MGTAIQTVYFRKIFCEEKEKDKSIIAKGRYGVSGSGLSKDWKESPNRAKLRHKTERVK